MQSALSPEPSEDSRGAVSASTRLGFERQVRDALAHLHDPGHLQSHSLTRFFQAEASPRPASPGRALRQSLLDAVESLRPTPGSPVGPRTSRAYQILKLRFVEGLEIPQVLDRLSVSKSLYYLELQRAVEEVSAALWATWGPGRGGEAAQLRARPDEVREPQSAARVPKASQTGAEEEPGKAAIDRTLTNLPLQLTSFVGREREMAEVRRLLGTTRLLTLTGAGGCGKTRLAYQVAADLLEEYPDGVWLAELASLIDPHFVPHSVASALGLREQPGQPIVDTISSYLKPRHLLLVLDNCEHLLDASSHFVDALLRACPHLTMLVTSREALDISGETSYRVPSLPLPDIQALPPLADLVEYESVRLFVERARAVQPGFAPAEGNAAALARICWRLDGMPLAIELAAARVRGLSVEQIASRLDDRFRLLVGGSRTALRRQQTLRATIDWSYDLLSEPETVLLHRLSVFAGGWELEAAEAVCTDGGIACQEVVDLLLQLVDRSLVVSDTEQHPARYRLLETIREYVQEKLSDSGEASAVRDRHLEWYLALAERGARELFGPEQVAWVARLEQELDNLRVAQDWSGVRSQDEGKAIRLAAAMGVYFHWSGRVQETRERLEPVLARPGGEPAARVEALTRAAVAASWAGDWRRAQKLHEEAIEVAREAGDRGLIAYALFALSGVPSDRGERAKARALQEQALALAKELGDRRLTERIIQQLSATLYLQGDYRASRQLAEEGLVLCREIGDSRGTTHLLVTLGYVALAGGELARARALAEASLGQAAQIGPGPLASALRLLAAVARGEGDYENAEISFRRALIERQKLPGQPMFTSSFVVSLAGLWVVRGRVKQAVRLYGAVHAWLEAMEMPVLWFPPPSYEHDLAAARASLGEKEFSRAWAEGQAMTLEQAVEYALGDEG